MNRAKPQRARSGCSGLGAFIFLIVVIGSVVGWPIYLQSRGAAATGVITEKRESVRVHYGEWFRRFEIVAAYSVPGQALQRHAICDVDEKTYDSLHAGNAVAVHYFASLLNQPFLPATHLEPCSTMASISVTPALNRAVVAFIALLAILFLWRALRIRIAAWLLLPWLGLSFAYLALPRAEPEPERPLAATATVDTVDTITTIGGVNSSKSMRLEHPYQIVRLRFVPPGMDAAVVTIDKIDAGSVPNLVPGQSANIVYDSAHPRIARLQQGTRSFPGKAMTTVTVTCALFIGLLAILWLVGRFFRLLRWTRRV